RRRSAPADPMGSQSRRADLDRPRCFPVPVDCWNGGRAHSSSPPPLLREPTESTPLSGAEQGLMRSFGWLSSRSPSLPAQAPKRVAIVGEIQNLDGNATLRRDYRGFA